WNLVVVQEFDNALWSTGNQFLIARGQFAGIDRMQSVNILVGDDSLDYFFLVEAWGQWQLDEYSVDLRVSVELAEQCFQFVLGSISGKVVALGPYSNLVSRFVLGFEIGSAGRVITDLNCSEERLSAMLVLLVDLLS